MNVRSPLPDLEEGSIPRFVTKGNITHCQPAESEGECESIGKKISHLLMFTVAPVCKVRLNTIPGGTVNDSMLTVVHSVAFATSSNDAMVPVQSELLPLGAATTRRAVEASARNW